MTRPVSVLALCVAVALGVLTTCCTSTVAGEAVKSSSSVPTDDVPTLEESTLDGLMLSNSDLQKITGVEVEELYSAEEMNDNADLVSDLDCLGAIYPGEDAVYDDTDWTAIRDELLLEASNADQAVEFFESSREKWRECAKVKDIEVEDGPWVPDKVVDVNERTISLKAKVSGTLSGICGHAMGVVSNLIVEGFSCDVDDNDDAQTITTQLLKDAAEQ
jgi:hypothetical protein